jgi:GNAT superfamily N-acetyltransferase
MLSISTSYCVTRRSVIEGPEEIDSGAWPITWYRIAKGWGLLPYDFWPGQPKIQGAVLDEEPPNADEIAKRDRLIHYQRLRCEPECLYAIVTDQPVTTALQITKSWRNPPAGHIALDDAATGTVAVHSISPIAFDFDRGCFVFQNSWGGKWGDNGVGYLPFGYLARFMVEGWTAPIHIPAPRPIRPGIDFGIRRGPPSRLGVPWFIDILDGDNDVMVGWAHMVQKSSSFDVEEVFVRPDYRGRGFGSALVSEIKKAVPESLPIRFWIPWGDHCDANAPALLAWGRTAGLHFEPSGVRWAAYRAAEGAPVGALPELAWIPEKASSPLESLCEPEQRVGDDDSGFWDADKANRRAELVEKKYRSALSRDEMAEFGSLQEEFGRYQDMAAPLPPG